MTKIAIIVGGTRPGRGEAVARWVQDIARQRTEADYEIVDIADYGLPDPDEPAPPSQREDRRPRPQAWAEKIGSFDGYVFVTPEYNHPVSGALKSAIEVPVTEWHNKAAGFVTYGIGGGSCSVANLRLIMTELQIADVQAQVGLSLYTDFTDLTDFTPAAHRADAVESLLHQVVGWSTALASLRSAGRGTE
ncbi:NAD(P)H-dependent oxidoreductase [Pseudonocardia sp.]|jgi:NAD(P)H-dependent FMN reductase|uniref:NADPH-dependent FMN reductase n=1 Tax=Pseudonocardia sp. TaxID=60912 RepID=UPI0031FCFB66